MFSDSKTPLVAGLAAVSVILIIVLAVMSAVFVKKYRNVRKQQNTNSSERNISQQTENCDSRYSPDPEALEANYGDDDSSYINDAECDEQPQPSPSMEPPVTPPSRKRAQRAKPQRQKKESPLVSSSESLHSESPSRAPQKKTNNSASVEETKPSPSKEPAHSAMSDKDDTSDHDDSSSKFSVGNSSLPHSEAPMAKAPPSPSEQQPPAPSPKAPVHKAMYDFKAQGDDQVSFQDGDSIEQTEVIDNGWWIGTVIRTGERGKFPGDYVEIVDSRSAQC